MLEIELVEHKVKPFKLQSAIMISLVTFDITGSFVQNEWNHIE